MSDTNNDTSDVKNAAEHVDVEEISSNLQGSKANQQPENLTEKQETPFIDDDVRTDK